MNGKRSGLKPENLALLLGEGGTGALYEKGDDIQEVAALLVGTTLALAAGTALDYLEYVK